MLQQTLGIIKPDAMVAGHAGHIISMIEASTLRPAALKLLHLDTTQAKEFYSEHAGKPFYEGLVDYMSSTPVVVMVLEGDNAIKAWRELMGATNPADAAAGTIRRLYGTPPNPGEVVRNATHGSDSPRTAEREIGFFFREEEIVGSR